MRFPELAIGPAPQMPLEAFIARRARLARKLGEGHVAIIATHPPSTFSNDVEYPYRPHSDFWYLTGFAEPGCVLLVYGGSGRTALFLRDRKADEEIWTGRRLGVERAPETLSVDSAYDIRAFSARLPELFKGMKVHAMTEADPWAHRRVVKAAGRRLAPEDGVAVRAGGPTKAARAGKRKAVHHARRIVAEGRLIKEPAEMRLLQRACDLGVEGHLQAAKAIVPGAAEYQVDAAFAHHIRHHGSTGVGYPSICGCGSNGAVLHYIRNLDRLRAGSLFLIDAGCEWGLYTSDITRTYPVGGAFTPMQAKLYDLVLDAHQAAMKEVRPGVPFRQPHDKAAETLAIGLLDLGFLEGPIEKILGEKTYRSFFMHGTSHFLGLDVHDVGGHLDDEGKPRTLREGMVITIEPGLYFNPDFAKCPPGTEGIGIRIEDDVAVTTGGKRNLTRELPVDGRDVARLVR